MKRLLIGVGAIAATAFAIKKVIDYELANAEEDIYDCEEELDDYHYDDEEDFNEGDVPNEEQLYSQKISRQEDTCDNDVDEEELRRIFEEGSKTVNNIANDVFKGLKGFFESLPKVNISVNVDVKNKENKD